MAARPLARGFQSRCGLLALALSALLSPVTRPASASDASAGTPAQSTPAARQAFMSAMGALQRGEAKPAVSALDAVPADQFAPAAAALRTCILQRLAADKPVGVRPGESLAERAVAAYQDYWRQGLRKPSQREALAAALLQRLRAMLGPDADKAADFDTLEPLLQARLQREGLHMLGGVTPPFHELMLWRSQDEHDYDVALPEQVQHVRVFLIGDFLVRGWLDDASCCALGTGGWSADDGIYALAAKYPDLQGEAFRVSLLAHEAQHYADKSHSGWKLADWELEYRAKLVELALAQSTSTKLLQGFAAAQGDDPNVPHPYADKRVLAALRARLHMPDDADLSIVPLPRLQQAARAALHADTLGRAPAATGKPR